MVAEESKLAVKPETKPETKPEFVEYTGQASRREISKEDWLKAGVRDQEAVTWSFQNDFRVPKENFSQEAIRHLLQKDGRFTIAA